MRKVNNYLSGIIVLVMSIVLSLYLSTHRVAYAEHSVLRIGMEAAYPPYNWTQDTDENGAVAIQGTTQFANGYDVQIAKLIGEQLGRPVEVVKLAWEGLVPAVQSDKIDMIIAGMSPTTERKQSIDFTDAYYESQFVMVVSKNSQYANATSIDDFDKATVTGQQGTVHYDLLAQLKGAKVDVAVTNFSLMRAALLSGKLDAYISEMPEAISATSANRQLTYKVLNPGFDVLDSDKQIAIGIKKSSPLLSEINDALAQISDEKREAIMKEAIQLQPDESSESDNFLSQMWAIFTNNFETFKQGTLMTLFISIFGTVVGLMIGMVVGIIKTIPMPKEKTRRGLLKGVVGLLNAYIAIFRGTPMIVQSMVIYFGTSIIWQGFQIDRLQAALFIVSINTGAYLSEVVRGGIESIDKGQFEGAYAIGMSHFQTMTKVILPQMFKNILPAVGNEFVINVKDTSVLTVIGVAELYYSTNSVAATNYMMFQTFLVTAVIYFVLTYSITWLLRLLEKRLEGSASYELVHKGGEQNV